MTTEKYPGIKIGTRNVFHFTGALPDLPGSFDLNIVTDELWQEKWRSYLHQEPPGPLPEGAMAHFVLAAASETKTVSLELRSAPEESTGNLVLHWNHVYSAPEEGQPPMGSYAVILVPESLTVTSFHEGTDVEPKPAPAS